jgi:hypothetical protein
VVAQFEKSEPRARLRPADSRSFASLRMTIFYLVGMTTKLSHYPELPYPRLAAPVELHYTSAGCPVFSAALSVSEASCLKVCFNPCTCS